MLTFNNPREDLAVDAGKTITIRYKATLDDDAVTTIEGNPNTVELEYTNKIGSDGKPDGSTDKIHYDAIVYTFAVNIVKTAADKATPLSGVEFDLYEEVDENTEGAVLGSKIGMTGVNAGNYYKLVKHLTTNREGNVSASGLEKGTYYLVETKTAKGYKVSDGVHTITVVNRKGFDLPTTGGFGTLLFSGIGVLLVVAGVGVLLSLKKKNRS